MSPEDRPTGRSTVRSTSQITSIAPVCEVHDVKMVPCEVQFAQIDQNQTVTAVVLYDWSDGHIVQEVYALDEASKANLPDVNSLYLGDEIDHRIANGTFRRFSDIVLNSTGIIRIDDRREEYRHTYMFWWLGATSGEVHLAAEKIYYFFDDGDVHERPRLTKFDDVVALMKGVRPITDTSGHAGEMIEDIEGGVLGDFENRIVVWDLSAIFAADISRQGIDAA